VAVLLGSLVHHILGLAGLALRELSHRTPLKDMMAMTLCPWFHTLQITW